jgi:hypothetical protein
VEGCDQDFKTSAPYEGAKDMGIGGVTPVMIQEIESKTERLRHYVLGSIIRGQSGRHLRFSGRQ